MSPMMPSGVEQCMGVGRWLRPGLHVWEARNVASGWAVGFVCPGQLAMTVMSEAGRDGIGS